MLGPSQLAMAGALSGVMTTVVMAPGERIKSLLQVSLSLELSTNRREVSQCSEFSRDTKIN